MDYEKIFSEKLDHLISNEMNLTNTPGTAISIIENNVLDFTRCYGARDFEKAEAVTADTLFCVASVTKSFICAGILKLQEEGKLRLADPVNEYLPITIGFEDDPIQIHHLMSHQSGIPNFGDSMWTRNREGYFGISEPIPKIPFTSWEDGFRYLNGAQEYISRSGSRFHYNNFGYGILSKLITEVSGISFKEFLRRNIFDPLEMNSTGFYNEVRGDEKLSKGYLDKPGSKVNEFVHMPYDDIRLTKSIDEAAGGLFSTVIELGNYMIMHLQNGEYQGKQILSQESVESMQMSHFKENYPNAAFAGAYGQSISGYGYGFSIDENFHGHKMVQHSGSFIGASAWFAFLPGIGRGAIMLSNHHPSPRIFTQAILMEAMNIDCEINWPLLKLRNHHSKLTGVYHTYKGMNKIKIVSDGTQLIATNLAGLGSMVLVPKGEDPYTLNYYVPTSMGGQDPIQFVIEKSSTWLFRERNRWKKVSDV